MVNAYRVNPVVPSKLYDFHKETESYKKLAQEMANHSAKVSFSKRYHDAIKKGV